MKLISFTPTSSSGKTQGDENEERRVENGRMRDEEKVSRRETKREREVKQFVPSNGKPIINKP